MASRNLARQQVSIYDTTLACNGTWPSSVACTRPCRSPHWKESTAAFEREGTRGVANIKANEVAAIGYASSPAGSVITTWKSWELLQSGVAAAASKAFALGATYLPAWFCTSAYAIWLICGSRRVADLEMAVVCARLTKALQALS